MIDWKELAMTALMGAVYGGAGVLVAAKRLDVALLSALVIGVLRGGAFAIMEFKEPKDSKANKIFVTQTQKLKRIL